MRFLAPYLSFTTLSSSIGSSVYGQTVTLTAAVRAANPTDGTPTGRSAVSSTRRPAPASVRPA